MKGSGGTEGGVAMFGIGFLLSAVAIYLFLDSVVATAGEGLFSGMLAGWRGHGGGAGRGWGYTTSMGILFLPFLIAVIALFYDATKTWAWWLLCIGLGVIVVEILSHIRFMMTMKTSHLLGMILMFGAGVGLMLRSYRDFSRGMDQTPRDRLGDGGLGP